MGLRGKVAIIDSRRRPIQPIRGPAWEGLLSQNDRRVPAKQVRPGGFRYHYPTRVAKSPPASSSGGPIGVIPPDELQGKSPHGWRYSAARPRTTARASASWRRSRFRKGMGGNLRYGAPQIPSKGSPPHLAPRFRTLIASARARKEPDVVQTDRSLRGPNASSRVFCTNFDCVEDSSDHCGVFTVCSKRPQGSRLGPQRPASFLLKEIPLDGDDFA